MFGRGVGVLARHGRAHAPRGACAIDKSTSRPSSVGDAGLPRIPDMSPQVAVPRLRQTKADQDERHHLNATSEAFCAAERPSAGRDGPGP